MTKPRIINKAIINPKTGLVDDPIYPCYKGQGYCQIRTVDTERFECVCEPEICCFRVVKDKEGGKRYE